MGSLPTKDEICASINNARSGDDVFWVGMVLCMIGCAWDHETLQESIDRWRKFADTWRNSEGVMRERWDEMKQWGG